jgi:hypothetical protein
MHQVIGKGLLVTLVALMATGLGQFSAAAQRVDCGMAGSENSLPGTDFAGYWQSTFGLMHLIRLGANTIEGASTASGYFRGAEAGALFQGRFGEDTGRFYTGNVTLSMSQGGHCLKGTMVYDDDGSTNEIIGMRVHRPTMPYRQIYELTNRTEHLKALVGGVLNLSELDGPDFLLPDRPAVQPIAQPPQDDNPTADDPGTT